MRSTFGQGGHGFLEEDFEVVFGFAEKMFWGQAEGAIEFYQVPFRFTLEDL